MANEHKLTDSDFWVGLLHKTDANHAKAQKAFKQVRQNRDVLVITNYVVSEAGTVLSHKAGQQMARQFFDVTAKYTTFHIDEQLHKQSVELFKKQNKKGTSMVDCSNVIVIQHFGLSPHIFSFDKFYKKFDLKRII